MSAIMEKLKEAQAQAAERLERDRLDMIEREAVATKIDAALDGRGIDVKVGIIMATKLYGSEGSINFEDAQVDTVLQLLEALPPIERYLVGSPSGTSYRPLLESDSEAVRLGAEKGDGITLEINYNNEPEIDWWTRLLTGEVIRITARLSGLHGFSPMRTSKVTEINGVITRRWDCGIDLRMDEAPTGRLVRYAAGTRVDWPMMFRWWPAGLGSAMDWLLLLRDKLEARGVGLRSAYLKDKELFLAGRFHAFRAEYLDEKAPYAQRTLRAGTERQTAALETPEAVAEFALIRKHQEIAARDPDFFPKPVDGRVEHYDWAKARLERLGLLVDNGYTYGTAWL